MMKIRLIILICSAFLTLSMKMDKPAYRIYNTNGKQITYSKMLKALSEADIICFGELHNDPIAHWMELELTRDLYNLKGENLLLGAEMFESDNQLLVDEYLSKLVPDKNFEDEARLWNNYKTDYKPLLSFARDSGLRFIATNIPRRYAAIVYEKGFEGLEAVSPEAKYYIAPYPIDYDPELPGYKAMLEMGGMGHKVNENLPRAQAIKDATMAWFILSNHQPGKIFLHFNGAYHSDNHEGIVWYLKKKSPALVVMTICTIRTANPDDIDPGEAGKADFIIAVPETMTNTY